MTSRTEIKAKMAPAPTSMERKTAETPRLELTAGFLYVVPDIDRSGRSSPKLGFGMVTGSHNDDVNNRYVLYRLGQEIKYGEGFFVPWDDVVSLIPKG